MQGGTVVLRSKDRDIFALLRSRAPEVSWTEEHDDPDATIDDDGSGSLTLLAKGSRRGEGVTFDKEEFRTSPGSVLRLALALAETTRELAAARRELEFADHLRELITTDDPSQVYEQVTRAMLDLIGGSAGTLLLHDSREERFIARYNSDPSFADEGGLVPAVPTSLIETAMSSDANFAASGSMVIFPIRLHDDLIGVIRAIVDRDQPDDSTLEEAARYLSHVGPVLAKIYLLTRSEELAMLDDLTHAYNRRFFESYLEEEVERARRYGSVLSIIFLDLDDLKHINNEHGHLAGSRTLQEVARRVLAAVRSIDKVVRFGGDEFCIILPQTDPERAAAVAERVRRSIASRPIELEGESGFALTASFGVASYPSHASDKEQLIRKADEAMFAVKTSTKNSIRVAGAGA